MSIPNGKRENVPQPRPEQSARSGKSAKQSGLPEKGTSSPGNIDRGESTGAPRKAAEASRSSAGNRPARQTGPTILSRDAQKWERVLAQLKARLGPEAFASWFGRCRLENISKSQLTISVPTTFLKSWIKTHYGDLLLELWQKQASDLLRIDIVVRSAVRSANSENGEATRPSRSQESGNLDGEMGHKPGASHVSGSQMRMGIAPVQRRSGVSHAASPGPATGRHPDSRETSVGFSGSPLDPNFTFSSFVEGSSNRMACAAARSVAEADGTAARFNPLFIHANVGLGKTHLLQAIAWAANSRNSGTKILYLTAEYFMWRFASAIRDSNALSFKESLRDIDLLLIDDMQFLQGKSIQQEFCHLLNALIDSARQVVVAADRPPSQLESLDKRVRSRLQGGVALEVKAPGLEMRQTMLELRYKVAQQEDPNLDIPMDILEFVAGKVTSSGRDLEGAFNQLLIQHRFSDGPVDIEAIEKMLGHLVQSGEQKRVRIEDIQKVAARHYNVTKNDLLSNRRTRIIVRPRQIAMYLSKILTPRSLPEIGRRFGGRDHTTVLHAVRKIEGLLKEDDKLAHEIELLKRLIHEIGQ